MQKNKKTILLKSILFLSSLFCGVLLLEALLRVFPANNNLYYRGLKWSHWGKSGMISRYNKFYVDDGVLGYEKKDIYENIKNVLKNDPSSYKILILGDSISQWGGYVEYFENLLFERYNKRIKVINAGVMGYDTELEYRYLKYRGLELNPNCVIIQFCVNDFMGTPIIIKQKDGSWFALSGDKMIARWINPRLFARSRLYEFISLRVLYYSNWRKHNKNNVKVPLQKIKDLLEAKRIPFYVLVFPWFAESQCVESGYDTHRRILDILDELNLSAQAIDLLPYYSRMSFDKIRKDLIHPNEEGSRIAAIVLMDKLKLFLDERVNVK